VSKLRHAGGVSPRAGWLVGLVHAANAVLVIVDIIEGSAPTMHATAVSVRHTRSARPRRTRPYGSSSGPRHHCFEPKPIHLSRTDR
jgi:hypothetical protein